MKPGFYYDSHKYRGKDDPFWLVGELPTGELLLLRNRSDGTNYYDKLTRDAIPHLRKLEEPTHEK